MVGKQLGHFRIVEALGAGGMGVVFRARDDRLGRDVALKLLLEGTLADDALRQRFRREALALARLNHPNIGAVYELGEDGGLDFLVMEYVPGVTLASELATRGALPEAEAIAIAEHVGAALGEAHARGIIHRDLKPGNILITPARHVKVVDFGLALQFGAAQDDDLTIAHSDGGEQFAGTLPYMSPEQIRALPLDPRSDVYSLGVVVYEMLTGVGPFKAPSAPATMEAILYGSPAPPSTVNRRVSPRLDRIVLQALAKDPASRYASAAEFIRALRHDDRTGAEKPPPAPDAARASGLTVDSVVAVPTQVFGIDAEPFLADAVPATLSTYLSHVPGLDTKLPPSSAEYDRIGRDASRLATMYGVAGLVLSTIAVQRDRFVLTLQLVDAETRRMLWSHEYERPRQDYVDLIREGAEGIRQALRASHPSSQSAAPVGTGSETELLLREGYYHGNLFVGRGNLADFQSAVSAFARAFERSPGQADAAAEIARLHGAQLMVGVPAATIVPLMREWAHRAIAVNAKTSTAWAALSEAEQIDPNGRFSAMLDYALKATTFGPENPYAHTRLMTPLSWVSMLLSLEAARRASSLDPLSLTAPLAEALAHSSIGCNADALVRIEHVLAIEPDLPYGVMLKALVLVMAGQAGAARALIPLLMQMVERRRLRPEWLDLATAYVDVELDTEASSEARSKLERLARGEVPFPRWETATAMVAPLLARRGRTEDAIGLLETRRDKKVLESYDFYLLNPDFDDLRRDPRFDAIVVDRRCEFDRLVQQLRRAETRNEFPAYLKRPLAELIERTAA